MKKAIVTLMCLIFPGLVLSSDYIILKCDYSEVRSWSSEAPETLGHTEYYKIYMNGPDKGARFRFDIVEGGWDKKFGRMKITEGALDYESDVTANRTFINRRNGDYRSVSDLGSAHYYRGRCSPMDGEPTLQKPKF